MTKTILQIIPELDGGGGAQKVAIELHEAFKESGYQMYLSDFDLPESQVPTNYRQKLQNEFKFLGSAGNNPVSRLIKRVSTLKKLKKSTNASYYISHMDGGHIINILSGSNCKNILVLHGSITGDKSSNLIPRLIRFALYFALFRFASRIVCVSKEIEEELITVFLYKRNKIVSINNFFDSEKIIDHSNEKVDISNTENRIILSNVGRLETQKNQETLVPIISHLNQTSQTKYSVIVMGSGSFKEKILNLARDYKLKVKETSPAEFRNIGNYDIILLGHVSNPFPVIKFSDFFILPSQWEGFPLALGEAMLCQTPVLTADFPTGAREMLDFQKKIKRPLKNFYFCTRGILFPIPYLDDSTSLKLWVKGIQAISKEKEILNKQNEMAYQYARQLTKTNSLSQWRSNVLQ